MARYPKGSTANAGKKPAATATSAKPDTIQTLRFTQLIRAGASGANIHLQLDEANWARMMQRIEAADSKPLRVAFDNTTTVAGGARAGGTGGGGGGNAGTLYVAQLIMAGGSGANIHLQLDEANWDRMLARLEGVDTKPLRVVFENTVTAGAASAERPKTKAAGVGA